MTAPLISLLIPICDAEAYLPRCLDSVAGQRWTDFECVMVDDGSADGSVRIGLQYVRRDARFRLINAPHGGVAAARSLALRHARGRYVCWLDADDALDAGYLASLAAGLDGAGEVDLVMQGLWRIADGHEREALPSAVAARYALPAQAADLMSQVNVRDYGVSVGKLFRRALIDARGLAYSGQITVAEDLDFLLRYLASCRSVVVQREAHYRYCLRPGSVSHTVCAPERELSGLLQLDASWRALTEAWGEGAPLAGQRGRSLADYVHRVVIAPYVHHWSRRLRLAWLRGLPPRLLQAYGRWFAPTPGLRLVARLLSRGHYALADALLALRLRP